MLGGIKTVDQAPHAIRKPNKTLLTTADSGGGGGDFGLNWRCHRCEKLDVL